MKRLLLIALSLLALSAAQADEWLSPGVGAGRPPNLQLQAAAAGGFATMQPARNQGPGPWLLTDPYGNTISSAGTTCQGFDKLVAAASTNGWSWRVVGKGTITCSAVVSIPTCFLRHEHIDTGVTIAFTAQGSSNLVTMDSHENCDVQFLGSFSQNSADTGAVVNMAPTTNDGAGNTVFAASDITISSVSPGTGGIGVQMDPTAGGFIGNNFTIRDVNAGATGIKILNPGSGSIAFEQNKFFGIYNHGQTTRVIQIGTSSTNQGNIRYNVWHSGRIDPNAATVALDSWGSNDTFIGLAIDNETAAAATGLKFESGANGNTVVGGVVQATTVLSDSGTGNTYLNVKGITLSGSTALGTSAISSAACATVVTATATGALTTDIITASFNVDPTAVTGYVPLTTGMLTIIAYPTSGNVNFKVCNNTGSSITPGAITLNWRVVR